MEKWGAHPHQEFPGDPPPPGFRDASLTQSHNEFNESIETSIESKEVMTLLFKIINLMANLNILSDPLLALQMLYEGKGGGGGGEFGENYELGTVSKFNIIPVTSK